MQALLSDSLSIKGLVVVLDQPVLGDVYIGQVVFAEATTSVLIIYIHFKSDLSLCFSITILTFN